MADNEHIDDDIYAQEVVKRQKELLKKLPPDVQKTILENKNTAGDYFPPVARDGKNNPWGGRIDNSPDGKNSKRS